MDRIDNVDLRDALRQIAENNTFFHLDNDIGISFDQMELAAKLDDPTEKTLIWVSYPSGIVCYSERDVFQKDTRGFNGVLFHGFDCQSDRKLAYAVEVTGIEDGKVRGNLCEIDIRGYAETVRQNAVAHQNVTIFGNLNVLHDQTVMPLEEFNRRYPQNLPKMEYWRHEPNNLAILEYRLENAQIDREADCVPSDMWLHTSNLYDERYAFYANQTVQAICKLGEPNSPDRQTFSVPLNSYVANAFGPEQLGKLLDALPYKNAAFTIQKGQRGNMMVVVPRDEVLQERRGRQEKPSVLAVLQEAKVTAALGIIPQANASKRHGLEVR